MKRADMDMLLRDVLLEDEVIEVLHVRIPCEDTGYFEFSLAFQTCKADSDRKWNDVIYWLRKTFPGVETRTGPCKKVWNFPDPDEPGLESTIADFRQMELHDPGDPRLMDRVNSGKEHYIRALEECDRAQQRFAALLDELEQAAERLAGNRHDHDQSPA